jgi:transcriptional regulator with XRE-family HTH domain
MRDLAEVADTLRQLRQSAQLSQAELGARAGVPRVTLARMENASQGDMSVSTLLRLLTALGQELLVRPAGNARTLEDILAEQRGTRPDK